MRKVSSLSLSSLLSPSSSALSLSYAVVSLFLFLFCASTSSVVNAQKSDLPTGATVSNPVRVFIQSGQSECMGQASPSRLRDEASQIYPDLLGKQDDVWLSTVLVDEVVIQPMELGLTVNKKKDFFFGPEIAMGRRLADAAAAGSNPAPPIMIIKYCIGGSDVVKHANPASANNCWDRSVDAGTADWLLKKSGGAVNLLQTADTDREHLYANLIYTIRKSVEMLENDNIPYTLEGLFWIQGAADNERTWNQYGRDLRRLYETLRMDIGQPNLPVVDNGGSPYSNIETGKRWAASVLDNVSVVEWGIATHYYNNNGKDEFFVNNELFNHYGWDPTLKAKQPELVSADANNKEFMWYKNWPSNRHSEYDGSILKGRMIANHYVRTFGSSWMNLNFVDTNDEKNDDPAILFPWDACNQPAGPENICWSDLQPSNLNGIALDVTGEISCKRAGQGFGGGGGGGGKFCFSSMSTVIEEKQGKMKLKNLIVGQKVLTKSGQYQTVYTIDHQNEKQPTRFLQIHFENYGGSDSALPPLELTESHMVFLHSSAKVPLSVPASVITVGDRLETTNNAATVSDVDGDTGNGSGFVVVTKIVFVEREGFWNPITSDGTIVVDGIIASTYSDVLSTLLHERSYKPLLPVSHHQFMHMLMQPYLFVCTSSMLSRLFCANSSDGGSHVVGVTDDKVTEGDDNMNISSIKNDGENQIFYSRLGISVLQFGLRQNIRIQNVMLSILYYGFSILDLILTMIAMQPIGLVFALMLLFCTLSSKVGKKGTVRQTKN